MKFVPFVALVLLFPTIVFADEDSCNQSCAEGEVLVGFADGSDAKCICQERGAPMQETPDAPISCVDPEDDGSCQ